MLSTSAETGKFIPGIHNYCDRLCETCRFSHRCYAYDLEKKQTRRQKPDDESAWVKMVLENMEEAMALFDKIQNDSNGSAKIALIAIDKSLSSWQILLKKCLLQKM